MKIAIIGAGNVGRALATSMTRAGHQVVISARDVEHAGAVAAATGSQAAASSAEAATQADVVVLAIPFASVREVVDEIRDAVVGKPVVDVTNRMSFGPDGAETDTTSSNAEEIADLLPGANVVKAFNTLFASNQSDPMAESVPLDGYVAGDDATAKTRVLELVDSMGLNPVDVGPLARARQLEGLAFLNITLNMTHGGSWQSGWKLIGAPTGIPHAA